MINDPQKILKLSDYPLKFDYILFPGPGDIKEIDPQTMRFYSENIECVIDYIEAAYEKTIDLTARFWSRERGDLNATEYGYRIYMRPIKEDNDEFLTALEEFLKLVDMIPSDYCKGREDLKEKYDQIRSRILEEPTPAQVLNFADYKKA